jgi:hypothetical protein
MQFSQLKSGQRYLFYKNTGHETTQFRANFIDIIENTLRVSHYFENNIERQSLMTTMPSNWITKIETLNDITKNQILLLPEDILLMIDDYC